MARFLYTPYQVARKADEIRAPGMFDVPLGLLGRLGRILDTPARILREAITGMDEATGKDVLRKLGLQKAGARGFGPGLAGFLAEVAMDPLTYVGGLGVATKTGKALKGATALAKQRRAVAPLARSLRKMGTPEALGRLGTLRQSLKYAPGQRGLLKQLPAGLPAKWSEQASAGLRQLVGLDIPFTGIRGKVPIPGEGRILDLLQPVAGAIRKSPPAAALSRVFNVLHGRPAESQPLYQVTEFLKRSSEVDASKLLAQQDELAKVAGKLEIAPEEAARDVFEAVEASRGASRGAGHIAGRVKATWKRKLEDLKERFIESIAEEFPDEPRIRENFRRLIEGEGFPKTNRILNVIERAAKVYHLHKGKINKRYRTKFQELLKRGARLKKAFRDLDPELYPFVKQFQNINRDILQQYKAAGIGVEKLKDPFNLQYMRRLLGPEARSAKAEAGSRGLYKRIREFQTQPGAATQREPGLAGLTISEANKALKAPGVPAKSFIEDPHLATAFAQVEAGRATAHAHLAKGLVREFGQMGGEGMPAKEFFKKVGLELGPEESELLGRNIPQRFADEFLKVHEKIANPVEFQEFRKTLEAIRRYFAGWLLPMFPGYHVRNLTSDTFSSWLAGKLSIRSYIEAFRIYFNRAQREYFERLGVLHGGISREISASGLQRRMREEVFEGAPTGIKKLAHAEKTPLVGKGIQKGFKAGEAMEGISRIAHFLEARRQGMNPLEAVIDVKKYLFNADELTDIEKKYLRPFFFFYSWQRNAVERMAANLIEHPGRMAMLTRGVTQPTMEKGTVPAWIRSRGGFPLMKDKAGEMLYLAGIGSPLEALEGIDFLTGAGPGLGGKLSRGLSKIASQAAPPYAPAFQLMAGKDLRLQRPLEELDKVYQTPPWSLLPGYKVEKMPSGTERPRAHPYWAWAMRSTPMSRLFTEIGQAADESKPLLVRILNVGTGAKVPSVDVEDERLRQAIEAISQRLRGIMVRTGAAKPYRGYFAVGEEGEKDPEVQQLLQLQRKLLKQRREQWAAENLARR